MLDALKKELRAALAQPRVLKPQTERHMHEYLDEAEESYQDFFDAAAARLEDYQIEMLFGPVYTPSMAEQARFSDLVTDETPATAAALAGAVEELAEEALRTEISLPDGTTGTLPLHLVTIERYVKLLRLTHAPTGETAAALRAAAPEGLTGHVLALARHRAFATAERQAWLAEFLESVAGRRRLCEADLETLADLMASQRDLSPEAIIAAARDALRSAQTSLNLARQGHQYLSSDVAEHHQFRGQGTVDRARVQAKTREVELLEQLEADLRQFLGVAAEPE